MSLGFIRNEWARTRYNENKRNGDQAPANAHENALPPDRSLDSANAKINQARRANQSSACPALFAKIFQFTSDPNHLYIHRHPDPHKGAFRDRHER
jgi:hypothetical protein